MRRSVADRGRASQARQGGARRRLERGGKGRLLELSPVIVEMPADDAAGFADVHLVGHMAVVGVLVFGQAPHLEVLPALGRNGFVVLQEPHQAESELEMPLRDSVASVPVAVGIVVILAGKDGAVDVGLVIRAVGGSDVFSLVANVFLAVVVRWFRNRNPIDRIGGNAETVVVSLNRTIGGEGTGRVDAALTRIVCAYVEPLPVDALR